MSNGADWFAKKMAPQGQAPRPSPVQPQTYVNPQGLRLPVTQPVQPVQQAAVQQATTGTITGKENFQALIDEAQRNGDQVTFTKLSRHWKGGEAMRQEGHLHCPRCDSLNVFTRNSIRVTNSNTGVTGSAKPRCFDCGWTEDHIQGEAANWGG